MITEDYVSFETAKLLKEKGLEGYKHSAMYDKNGILVPFSFKRVTNSEKREFVCDAPTLQMAMKWLREVHGIHIEICLDTLDGITPIYRACYSVITNISTNNFIDFANTCEEACEIGIKYCLENLI